MEDPLYNFANDNTFGLEGDGTTGGFGFGQGQAIIRDTGIQMSGPSLDATGLSSGLDLAQRPTVVSNSEIILPTKCLPPQKLKTLNRYVGDVIVNYGGNYFDEETNFDGIQNQVFNDNVYNDDYDLPNQVTNNPYSQDIFSNQPLSEPFTQDVYGGITNTYVLDGLEDSGTPVSYDVPTTFNKIPYTPAVTTPITFTEQVLPTTKIISTVTPQPEVIVQPTTVTQVYEKPLVTTAPIITQPPPVVTTTAPTPIVTTTPIAQIIPSPAPLVVPKTQVLAIPTVTSGIAAPRPTTIVAAPKPVQVVSPPITTVMPPPKPIEFPPASPVLQTALPRLVATNVVPRRPSIVVGPRPVIGAPVLQSKPVIPAQALRTVGGASPSIPLVGRPSMPTPFQRIGNGYGLGFNYKGRLNNYRPRVKRALSCANLKPGLI